MSERPSLSVIIPWRNRAELGLTLQRNRRFFSAHPLEVVVVNVGGDASQLEGLLGARRPSWLRAVSLPETRFNKALALNLGVAEARADRLFLLDADVVLREDFLGEVEALLRRKCFATVERVFESEKRPAARRSHLHELTYAVQLVDKRGRVARVETNRVRLVDGSRSGPGLVMLRRQHFLAVGGMNSVLVGWGWEDVDLLVRLQLELGLKPRRLGSVVHLTHGDDKRSLEGRSRPESEQLNFLRCLECYRRGWTLGTYEEDVARWRGLLRPVPASPR